MYREPAPATLPGVGVKLPHLRAWRLARGLRAVELAYQAHITPAWVYELEACRQGASKRVVHLLAYALGIQASTLLQRAPAARHDMTAGTQHTPAKAKGQAPAMAAVTH